MVFHNVDNDGDACDPSTWEVKVEGSEVQGHSWAHREFEASLGFLRPYLKKQQITRLSQEEDLN